MCSRCSDRDAVHGVVRAHTRRDVLKWGALGGVALGTSAFLAPAGLAQGGTVVRAPYGAGFCNLGLFVAHARQLPAADGVTLDLIATPTFADHITMIGTGAVDVSVTPYTTAIALLDRGAPIRIVAGGGIEGCALVSRPGLASPESLPGTTLGTFQMDSLELLAFDWLAARGVDPATVTVRYMGSVPEAVEAFKAGALDWVTTVEPYATTLLRDVPGSHLLSDGRDIYGPGYADCVLTAQERFISERPEALRAIIKALFQAQKACETELDAVLSAVVGTYYKTSLDSARIASSKQPIQVDVRDQEDFIVERTRTLAGMGYLRDASLNWRTIIDWSALEDVIAANPALYASLERRSG